MPCKRPPKQGVTVLGTNSIGKGSPLGLPRCVELYRISSRHFALDSPHYDMSEITPAQRLAQDIKTDVTLIARIDEQPGGDVEVGGVKKPIDCTSYPFHPFDSL